MDLPFFSNSSQPVQQPLVLAVEDNEDNLLILTQALELFGCDWIAAEDGHTALNLAQHYRPDLILLDILLPGLSGIDTVQQLKQSTETQSIPVIAVTALTTGEDQNHILQSGCSDYISKPYTLETLETLVRQHLPGKNLPVTLKLGGQ